MRTGASRPELIARIVSFARDRRGVSAIEFAMLLPVMVTLTTRTMADLASRVTSINNADMTNMLNATSAVIAPYDQSMVKVVLSAVNIDANGIAKIGWSDTLHGSARAVGSTVAVPSVLAVPNTTLIWSEVSYNYNPTFGYVLTGNMNLNDQIYMRPRLSDTITRVNSCPARRLSRSLRNRQRRGRLDPFHGEARRDVLERHRGNQPLVEGVIARDVAHHDPQHVVDVAGHPIELHHFRHGANPIGKLGEPILRVVAGLDRHEHGHAEAELVLVDQRHPLLDHPVRFEALDPLPARRRGQAHPVADLGHRERGIVLQQRENLAVDRVHVRGPIRDYFITN